MKKQLTFEELKLEELTAYLVTLVAMTSETPNKLHEKLVRDYMKLAFNWGKLRGGKIEYDQHKNMFHKDWIK